MKIEYTDQIETQNLPKVRDLEPGTPFWWAGRPVLKLCSGVVYEIFENLNETAHAVCIEFGNTYGSPTMADARVHVIKGRVVIHGKEPL